MAQWDSVIFIGPIQLILFCAKLSSLKNMWVVEYIQLLSTWQAWLLTLIHVLSCRWSFYPGLTITVVLSFYLHPLVWLGFPFSTKNRQGKKKRTELLLHSALLLSCYFIFHPQCHWLYLYLPHLTFFFLASSSSDQNLFLVKLPRSPMPFLDYTVANGKWAENSFGGRSWFVFFISYSALHL